MPKEDIGIPKGRHNELVFLQISYPNSFFAHCNIIRCSMDVELQFSRPSIPSATYRPFFVWGFEQSDAHKYILYRLYYIIKLWKSWGLWNVSRVNSNRPSRRNHHISTLDCALQSRDPWPIVWNTIKQLVWDPKTAICCRPQLPGLCPEDVLKLRCFCIRCWIYLPQTYDPAVLRQLE